MRLLTLSNPLDLAYPSLNRPLQQHNPFALHKSISSCAHYVTLQKYFSRPSLVIYFFATPPIKLKLGQQIGGGLLIANHLDQSLW